MNYDNMTPDQIVDAVIAQQRAKGIAKYGAPLAPNVVPNLLEADRKSTRLNSSHSQQSRMPSSA